MLHSTGSNQGESSPQHNNSTKSKRRPTTPCTHDRLQGGFTDSPTT